MNIKFTRQAFKDKIKEQRSNTFDNGQYWVCEYCHKPIPNGTKFVDEIWSDKGICCNKRCQLLLKLKEAE